MFSRRRKFESSAARESWSGWLLVVAGGFGGAVMVLGVRLLGRSRVVVGAKNFTEQVVLGELVAQEIEAVTGERVERRFYLAGSYLCQQALVSGRIDGYVEYTGTALTAILKQPLPPVGQRDAASVFGLRCGGCMRRGMGCGWGGGWGLRIRLRWWCGGRMRGGWG